MADELFELKKYSDINKLAVKYPRLLKVIIVSHENSNGGGLSAKYIIWEKEEDGGKYPGHGSGNTKWDNEYFTSPIKNYQDLKKFVSKNKNGGGWRYQDTWGGWKGQRGNTGLKDFLTLEAGRCIHLYGLALLSPKSKITKKTAKKTVSKKPDKVLPIATPKSRVQMAKKLLAEGKLKTGHVTRLGIKRQTQPAPKSKAVDRQRSAMLPGYRVSENGNLYYEARENRSDTPLERRDKAYIFSQRKLQRGARLHDKYKPPRTPVIRKPKIIPKVQKKTRVGADNRLLDVLEGHWFDYSSEYQLLEAKDGDSKGMFFAWERKLPPCTKLSSRMNFKSEWKLLFTEPIGKTLSEAISNFERIRSVKTRTGIKGALYTTTTFRMTAGLYDYIEKLHSSRKIAPMSNSKLISTIRKYERVIGLLRDHEENIAVSEFGDVLYESFGGPHSCRLPPYVERFSKIDTHNHPGRDGWFGPSTFSIKTAYTNTSGGDLESYQFWSTRSLGEIRRTCSDGMAFTIFPNKLTFEMKKALVKEINEKYGGLGQSDVYRKASERDRYGIMCNTLREVFKKVLPKEVYYEEKL